MPPPSLFLALLLAQAAPAAKPSDGTGELFHPAQRWALVVGAGEYETLGRLKYANADAHALADALVSRLGFAPDTVRLLTDDADDPRLRPTAGHVLNELEALLADDRRTRSDLFVFYFCGHGIGLEQGDYLLPTDAGLATVARLGLPAKEVFERLARAGMRNVLVLVDACREGESNPFGRELFELADGARLALVLGCEPGAQSYEDARLGHGAFTHFLLEALARDELCEPVSGALWASRVAAAASARVGEWSQRKRPPQHPVAWTDPTRDVLLLAAPPAGRTDSVSSFVAAAERLEPEAHQAALGSYAEALYRDGRKSECVEVLKTAEQLGPLSRGHLLYLGVAALDIGRTVEAARAFRELRDEGRSSLMAAIATVLDESGAVTPGERADAARALWDAGERDIPGLLVSMVEAMLEGGAGAEAQVLCETALALLAADSREAAFLRGARAAFRGEDDDALAELARAEGLPGSQPSDGELLSRRVALLLRARGPQAALELVERCIARWPEDGEWLAERVYMRLRAEPDADPRRNLADLRAALELQLSPDGLLTIATLAGADVHALAEAIAKRAAEFPQAWTAQLAALFVRRPADLAAALEGVSHLAPRPSSVYVAYAKLAFHEARALAERTRAGADEAASEAADARADALARQILELLAPRAGDFGADAEAWELLGDFYRWHRAYEARARRVLRFLGPLVDGGRLPPELARSYALACLNSGRLAHVQALERTLDAQSLEADGLAWLCAAYCAAFGDDAAARAELGARTAPRDAELAPLAAPLLALLDARAGREAEALARLPAADPEDELALALTGLAARALGDREREGRVDARLHGTNATEALFARVGFWTTAAEPDATALAVLGGYSHPGNALLRTASFADEPGLAAFSGVYEFTLEDAPGPLSAAGAELTLTVLPSGKVLGALIAATGDALVIQGEVDEYGNFEGGLQQPTGRLTLLAKLVPREMLSTLAASDEFFQRIELLDPADLPYSWRARPKE